MKTLLLGLLMLGTFNNVTAQTDSTQFKSAKDYIKHKEETDANMTKPPKRKITPLKIEGETEKTKSKCFFNLFKKKDKR